MSYNKVIKKWECRNHECYILRKNQKILTDKFIGIKFGCSKSSGCFKFPNKKIKSLKR